MRNPFEADYPEFHFGRLTRHILPCGPDGICTIQDKPQATTREAVMSAKKRHMGSSAKGRFRILAAEVDHLSGVVTFGYSIQEPEPPCNIDAAKAKALGVSPAKGSKFDLLKAGFSVWSDDGSQEVHPSQVLLERRRKARKITFVGDNRRWTPSMKTIAQDSDVLVHEATLMEKDSEEWQVRNSAVCVAIYF
jgi:ribonuclease BN (tRNA processing enzyme)